MVVVVGIAGTSIQGCGASGSTTELWLLTSPGWLARGGLGGGELLGSTSTEVNDYGAKLAPQSFPCSSPGRSCVRFADEQTLQSADLAGRKTMAPFPPKRRTIEEEKSIGIDSAPESNIPRSCGQLNSAPPNTNNTSSQHSLNLIASAKRGKEAKYPYSRCGDGAEVSW